MTGPPRPQMSALKVLLVLLGDAGVTDLLYPPPEPLPADKKKDPPPPDEAARELRAELRRAVSHMVAAAIKSSPIRRSVRRQWHDGISTQFFSGLCNGF